jgi:hypothetical protein
LKNDVKPPKPKPNKNKMFRRAKTSEPKEEYSDLSGDYEENESTFIGKQTIKTSTTPSNGSNPPVTSPMKTTLNTKKTVQQTKSKGIKPAPKKKDINISNENKVNPTDKQGANESDNNSIKPDQDSNSPEKKKENKKNWFGSQLFLI